jgi:glycosyltransferase involved in cell wall biosynthesis
MPKKNRIVIFGWAQSVHIQRWAEGLTKRGWHIKVVSLGGEQLSFAETTVFPHTGSFGYLKNAGRARKEAEKFQPDLLHVHYAFGFGWWGIRSHIHPMITSLWGTDVASLSHNPLTQWFGRWLFQKSAAVTSSSQYLTQQAMTNWPEIQQKLTVIPFGVEIPETISPLPPLPVQIAYAKWHRTVYGPDILLQAMQLLKERGVPIHLNMTGSGEMTDELQAMIQSLRLSDMVSMVGKLAPKEIPAFLRKHHLMVMPSRMESFGVSALEAAAVGRAVIASDVGGIPEVVQQNKTGILVPPENPEALADAIQRLAENPTEMERMGKAGYEMVKAQYNWQRSLDIMSELYERVIHAAH